MEIPYLEKTVFILRQGPNLYQRILNSVLTYLIEQQFSSLLFAQVHFLDCHLAIIFGVGSDAYNACGALADLDEVL